MHYEVVYLICEDKFLTIQEIIDYYVNLIKDNNGIVHRLENWGLRILSYAIKNMHKAFYILMNIEIFHKSFLTILSNEFYVNKSILRFIFFKQKKAIKEKSCILL